MLLTAYKDNLFCFVTQTAQRRLVRIIDLKVHQLKLQLSSQQNLKESGHLMHKTVRPIHLKLLYLERVVLQKLQLLIHASLTEIV